MCRTTIHSSPTCEHTWLILTHPCVPGANLLTCPLITSGGRLVAPMPRRATKHEQEAEGCPRCDYESYDMRRRRVVRIERVGFRWGVGPEKGAGGVDFGWRGACCGVM